MKKNLLWKLIIVGAITPLLIGFFIGQGSNEWHTFQADSGAFAISTPSALARNASAEAGLSQLFPNAGDTVRLQVYSTPQEESVDVFLVVVEGFAAWELTSLQEQFPGYARAFITDDMRVVDERAGETSLYKVQWYLLEDGQGQLVSSYAFLTRRALMTVMIFHENRALTAGVEDEIIASLQFAGSTPNT